jgi:hypothetical protein
MSTEDSIDYDKVKEAILRRYDITEETYRQRFRSIKKGTSESYREMYVRLKDVFSKWTKPETNSKEKLAETLIMEQLVDNMSPGVQIWVREHKPKSGTEAADLADDYADARRGIQFNSEKKFPPRNSGNRPSTMNNRSEKKDSGYRGGVKTDQSFTSSRPESKPPIICRRCKEPGHIEKFCKKPKEALHVDTKVEESHPKHVTTYVCKGYIDGQETEIKLDSGADVVIVHSDLVEPSKVKQHMTFLCLDT